MFTKAEPLWYFKFQHSKNDTGTKFKHTVVDKLPSLHYRFAEGSNWNASDYRVTAKLDEIYKWFDNYWESRPNPKSVVNRGLYEKELEDTILKAYEELNKRWNLKLEKDFEEAFDDKLLGFMSGVKQNNKD